MTEKFETRENNSAELKYYFGVTNRITQKLRDATE